MQIVSSRIRVDHRGFFDEDPYQKKKKSSKEAKSQSLVDAAKRHGKNVLSDEVILEIRTLREKYGMTSSQIIKKLHQCNLNKNVVEGIFNYNTRAHLVPKL